MSDIEKTEISLVGSNKFKLKTTADFLGLPLSEVVNACLYLGVFKIWIPIARIIDELPEFFQLKNFRLDSDKVNLERLK